MLKQTRDEFKETMIQTLAVAAVARKLGCFTDSECEALKPEITQRANAIHAFFVAVEQVDSVPPPLD